MDREMDKALRVLHIAADKIMQIQDVYQVTVESDNDSGEIFFMIGEKTFALKLTQCD